MSEDCVVEIGLVAHVQDAEVAGVEAEDAGEEDDDEGVDVAGAECVDREDEDESADHPIHHPDHCHGGTQDLVAFNSHLLF